MKNYFQKILTLFTRYSYSANTEQHFYRWLTNSDHENEKIKALKELFAEAQNMGEVENLEKSLSKWKINNGIAPILPHKESGRKLHFGLWQSAATVLLIISLSLGYLLYQVENTETDLVQQFIPTAEMKNILLPDGSQVQINSQSTLLYPRQFTGQTRSVYLIGEANFKVKPDKHHPFVVKSGDFQITALGTEFNVTAYADKDISTTLLSGRILVQYDNMSQQVILSPNQQFSFDKKSRKSYLNYPDIDDVTAWQRGELVFRQTTVSDIIRVLERKYNYKFIYSLHDLKNDRFSFRFRDDASLTEVMDVIVDVAGYLDFKIEKDKCYIMQK